MIPLCDVCVFVCVCVLNKDGNVEREVDTLFMHLQFPDPTNTDYNCSVALGISYRELSFILWNLASQPYNRIASMALLSRMIRCNEADITAIQFLMQQSGQGGTPG